MTVQPLRPFFSQIRGSITDNDELAAIDDAVADHEERLDDAETAIDNLTSTTKVLLQVSDCGFMYGKGSPNDIVVASKVIPGGTIRPGSLLKFAASICKYAPATVDTYFKVKIVQGANTVEIGYSNTAPTSLNQNFDGEWFVSTDLKWLFPKGSTTKNFYNNSVMTAGTVYSLSTSFTGQNGARNPRARSQVALVSYSGADETILIDLTQECRIDVTFRAGTADQFELLGASLTMLAPQTTTTFDGNPLLTIALGDSLTEGAGATLTGTIPNDWVSVLGRIRTGTPFKTLAIGGQKAQQIIDRIVCDGPAGKNARLLLWIGENDIGVAADPAATIKAQIDRLIAYRGGTQDLIIFNLIPSDNWTAPQLAQKDAANVMLNTYWPSLICDIQTPLTTGGVGGLVNNSYQSDYIHLNNAGYAIVANTADAKMTSLAWAV
jgi:lysophospholipase L1-like esterase